MSDWVVTITDEDGHPRWGWAGHAEAETPIASIVQQALTAWTGRAWFRTERLRVWRDGECLATYAPDDAAPLGWVLVSPGR